LLLTALSRWREPAAASAPVRIAGALGLSTLLIAGKLVRLHLRRGDGQTRPGQPRVFHLPLVNVLLGLVVFRDRLRPAQWVAVALASVGVGCSSPVPASSRGSR